MRQVPYRLLAALTITLTLGGCVTYPATPVFVEKTYVRKATPVYSYSVMTDPGYRYYDDILGVYVFYDRSDVFYRQGRYYRWYQDHWISASHWRGPWYPAPNLYISGSFNDRWHTRLRRHGHRYAGGHHPRPPRRHGHDDGYNRRDWHDSNGHRDDRWEKGQDQREKGRDRREKGWDRREKRQDQHEKGWDRREKGWDRREKGWDRREKGWDRREKGWDRREKGRDQREKGQNRREERQHRGRGGEHGFAGTAEPKRRESAMDNRSWDRGNERRKPHRNPSRDERAVKLADKPTGIRGPRVVPVLEHPATDRRTVRDRPKPKTQHGQPQRQRQRNAPNDRRNTAVKPAPRQERGQPKNEQPKKKKREKEKKSKKKTDRRDQKRLVREP
ncbi:hypothetical protein [Microbulbifer yueqingensis]|uniref:Lipoprotein n=1 Tax=Microbulbifer yueqingensis TaxID=658219 RepID=A0A1G9A2Z5_9GAMM|nr:hypothetical protein [Microbulbifer yueqingensis]SDK21631.1 hypothetical protein SAMN05216212_1837 [Microbulbifer yueqingensis]